MRTRKWQDQNGNDRYSTEIVLTGFDAKLVMLNGKQDGDQGGQQAQQQQGPADWDLEDDVPF